MRKIALAAAVFGLFVMPALAQTPAPDGTPTRIAGSVDKLDGRNLMVKAKDGQSMAVALAPDAAIYGVEKRAVADIKPGDFLASGGVRGSDGKIHAVEVRIFPAAMRGVGEGQRPWDVKPEGVMTNATVGTVTKAPDGDKVHVTYKGGDSDYTIGADVPILAYVAGDQSLLKPGAAVTMTALKKPDGTLSTGRVIAEKDGVKPPM